jgi:hypothetical protein
MERLISKAQRWRPEQTSNAQVALNPAPKHTKPTLALTLSRLFISVSFSMSRPSALVSASFMSSANVPQLYWPEPWRFVLLVAPLL